MRKIQKFNQIKAYRHCGVVNLLRCAVFDLKRTKNGTAVASNEVLVQTPF